MANSKNDNPIEVWARKMGFSPTTPQSSAFFQKLSAHPKMKIYMDALIKHTKPKGEVKEHRRRYLFGVLKQGHFSCPTPPKYTIENEKDIKLYKKHKNVSIKIELSKDFNFKEASEELSRLRCDFKKKENLVQVLLNEFFSLKRFESKLPVISRNLITLKTDIISNRRFIRRMLLERRYPEGLNKYLTDHFEQYENDVQIFFSMDVNGLLKESPENCVRLLIDALDKLNVNIEFVTFDFDLGSVLALMEGSNVGGDSAEEITDASLNDKLEKIKALYEKQNELVDSINDMNFNYQFDSLQERINKSKMNIGSNVVKFIQNIQQFSVKLEECLKVSKNLYDVRTNDNNTSETITSHVQTINSILNKWNIHMDDVNCSSIIEKMVNRNKMLKSVIDRSTQHKLTCENVELETEADSVLVNCQADKLVESCDLLKQVSELSKEAKLRVLKESKLVELVKIDGTPMGEVRSQLLEDCKELDARMLFGGD